MTRLISARETRGFAAYGRAHQATDPDHILLSKVAGLEAEYRRHWTNLVRDSAHIPQTFKTHAASLSPDERKAIRTHSAYAAMGLLAAWTFVYARRTGLNGHCAKLVGHER